MYADVCPHCHEELKDNTEPLICARKKNSQKQQSWPGRILFGIVRLVES